MMWIVGWLWSQCKGNWPHYISILENAQFYARAKSNWNDCSAGLCDAAGKIFSNQMSVQDALDEVQAICEEG